MQVKVEATIEVREDGEVVIRHLVPSAEPGEFQGVFGFPGRPLKSEEAMELCRNLAVFVQERFEIEVKAALAKVQRKKK